MAKHPVIAPKKLIEVALPLEFINKACVREKSIRHGHPSTLHLWWARRPLAAARAVLFAQLVNDPSWKYSEDDQKRPQVRSAITRKRNELFSLITELVQWESTANEEIVGRARGEILASWRETCEANRGHPDAATLFNPAKLPAFHDPFAGGGSIPLEAQRLGFDARASDLNPVAILINRGILEIPPRFAGRAAVGPTPSREAQTTAEATGHWVGAQGLAEDVRRYGAWLREEGSARLGYLYQPVKISASMERARADLQRYVGRTLPVITWLWARTVASPNPAAKGAPTPLVASYVLSNKTGNEAWVEATVAKGDIKLEVHVGSLSEARRAALKNGSRAGKAQDFVCLHTGSPVPREYVREEGKAGRLGAQLMAVVLEGDRERVYLSPEMIEHVAPTAEHAGLPALARKSFLSGSLPTRAMITGGVCSAYGLDTWGKLYTDRQIIALTTLSELVVEARVDAARRARAAGWGDDERSLDAGGDGAVAYGDALAVYLALCVSRLCDRNNTLCSWDAGPAGSRSSTGGSARTASVRNAFARQALPMTWDFAEASLFSDSGGGIESALKWVVAALAGVPAAGVGAAFQQDARTAPIANAIVSTDPPYFDNIGYAELSDFFYVWLRRALIKIFPTEFATLLVPKAEELVAMAFRHGSKKEAESYFLEGMTDALRNLAMAAHPAFPVTVYYAFKQSDTDTATGTASTGWEMFLEACLRAGLVACGTWPMRTELGNRLVGKDANALASSIILAFRRRELSDGDASRKEFLRELDRRLGPALHEMTADPIASIAPVDLAQAAIGPAIAIFSKYRNVLEADGSAMSVHAALVHINKAVDDYFAHGEGDLDADTRFCIGWFQQYGFESGPFGEADVLARAKGTAVDGVQEAGVLSAAKSKVRLLKVKEYPKDWDPSTDARVPVWEACHQMSRALSESEHDAGALLARMPEKQDAIRQLAYRLYTICERQKWAEEARAYNELVTSWPAIVEESVKAGLRGEQLSLV